MDTDRYAMATVSGIPAGHALTEENVEAGLREFKNSLLEREIYDASPRVTPGGSIGGRMTAPKRSSAPATATSGATSTGSGCYVATAVYGGYDAKPVRVLRRFRDHRLQTTPAGRLAVRGYYRLSPGLLRRFGNRSWFTRLLRPVLDAVTDFLQVRGYSDSPYDDVRQ